MNPKKTLDREMNHLKSPARESDRDGAFLPLPLPGALRATKLHLYSCLGVTYRFGRWDTVGNSCVDVT